MAASTPPDFGTGLRAALDARGNLDVPPLPVRFAELLQTETSDEPRAALPIAALAAAAERRAPRNAASESSSRSTARAVAALSGANGSSASSSVPPFFLCVQTPTARPRTTITCEIQPAVR